MFTYSVHFFCDECSRVHPVGISIALYDGSLPRASIGDIYAGKELPVKQIRVGFIFNLAYSQFLTLQNPILHTPTHGQAPVREFLVDRHQEICALFFCEVTFSRAP